MNRDNQQETQKYDKPTDAEIGWLAGLIEADGSVSLSCHPRDGTDKVKVGCEIRVYNTDAGIIAKVADIYTKMGLSHYIAERPMEPLHMANDKKYGGRDPMLSVSVRRLGAAFALGRTLLPNFYGQKRARLILMMQYLAQRIAKAPTGHSTVAIDADDLKLVLEFYQRFVSVRNKSLIERIERLLRDYT